MLLEERACLSCNKPLSEKMRKDAKFCNEYCRAEFNNRKRYGLSPAVARVDRINHKNYELLKKALSDAKDYVEVSKDALVRKGFKTDFCTQKRGTEYNYCYDLMFRVESSGNIVIGRAPDHVMESQFETEIKVKKAGPRNKW